MSRRNYVWTSTADEAIHTAFLWWPLTNSNCRFPSVLPFVFLKSCKKDATNRRTYTPSIGLGTILKDFFWASWNMGASYTSRASSVSWGRRRRRSSVMPSSLAMQSPQPSNNILFWASRRACGRGRVEGETKRETRNGIVQKLHRCVRK